MSNYTPPNAGDFVDGQPFDPAKTLAGFTDLSTAINGAMTVANLTLTGEINATRFQPGSVHIIADVRQEGVVEPLMIFPSNSTAMFGSDTNLYDLAGTGCRFYLHVSTKVVIRSRVQLLKGKHSWATAGVAPKLAYSVTSFLKVDGTSVANDTTRFIVANTTAATGANRGFSVDMTYEATLAAGAHTVHIRQDWDATTFSGGASDINGAQWYGTGARTTVVAACK